MLQSVLAALPLCAAFISRLVLASPDEGAWHGDHGRNCLTDAEAKLLVDVQVSISVSFDPAYVTPFYADDFTVQSDSINFLLGLPVCSAKSPSKSPSDN